jgi:hypothetical protein
MPITGSTPVEHDSPVTNGAWGLSRGSGFRRTGGGRVSCAMPGNCMGRRWKGAQISQFAARAAARLSDFIFWRKGISTRAPGRIAFLTDALLPLQRQARSGYTAPHTPPECYTSPCAWHAPATATPVASSSACYKRQPRLFRTARSRYERRPCPSSGPPHPDVHHILRRLEHAVLGALALDLRAREVYAGMVLMTMAL